MGVIGPSILSPLINPEAGRETRGQKDFMCVSRRKYFSEALS